MKTAKGRQQAGQLAFSPIPKLVYEALSKVVGRERAEVVDFYLDSRLASTDPDRYERALKDLLGEEGGRLVLRAMKSELAKSGHVHGAVNESFSGEVRALEKALVRSPPLK
jgi:hypothetical protein